MRCKNTYVIFASKLAYARANAARARRARILCLRAVEPPVADSQFFLAIYSGLFYKERRISGKQFSAGCSAA
jgi:hypothetical protein